MEEAKRLNNLQDEIKLLKGELKNSLASVRDYLLNMELPSSEFSTILAALSGDNPNPQKMSVDSNVDSKGDMPQPNYDAQKPEDEEALPEGEQPGENEDLLDFEEPEEEEKETSEEELPDEDAIENADDLMAKDDLLPEGDELSEELPEENPETEDSLLPEDETLETEEEAMPEGIEEEIPEDELPTEDEQSADFGRTNEANQGIPKVNMLANLISWVAKAKQEIGDEELPTFLEVYGISGHLSPELKDIIIRLAEITKGHNDNAVYSELWSQSMLSLHGILTGGDAPMNPVMPAWADTDEALEDEIIEIDKAKEKSPKLKLVFPDGDGKSKEFCIDLTPQENGDNGAAQ